MLNSSTFNNTFPFFYDDNNITFSHLSDEINPFSYYDQLQSPSIYYDMENYCDFLRNHDLITMIQEPLQATNSSVVTDNSSILEVATNKIDSNKGDEVSEMVNNPISTSRGSKRRRTSNKDRHSKIRTANGLRDRRMRLSLEVARPFFNLQDMLGYDKASRTVDWLLTQSKDAIEEVLQSKNGSVVSGVTKCTISSNSDCEGESIIVEQKKGTTSSNKGKKTMACVAKDGKNKEKRLRTTKEAMKKARDKARKRTLEKMQSRGIKDGVKFHHMALGACEMMKENNDTNFLEIKDKDGRFYITDHVQVRSYNEDTHSMNHKSGNWSSLTDFSYQQ